MKRILILVLDSVGIGGAPDAAAFGDQGADTLGHIAEACAAGLCDIPNVRSGPLQLPYLSRLGLGLAAAGSRGRALPSLGSDDLIGAYGHAAEISFGKDTPSGHWEMAGVPVLSDWGYFPNTQPCLPAWLSQALIEQGELPGLLGNCHASGTDILVALGEEHIRTGQPIVYSSVDSVLQIAAHEQIFGLERLYALCQIARNLVDELNIARVIARPFVGRTADDFKRTGQRRDYAIPPPAVTLLDRVVEVGGAVYAVGKIADIFAHRGISRTFKAHGNQALFDATLDALSCAGDNTLVMTNFVDFDMEFGHRRNISGYAQALEEFDRRLPQLLAMLQAGDRMIISADHGNDPSWPGTDHTREQVPVLLFGADISPHSLGQRDTFADIGQSVAQYLDLAPLDYGKSFI